MQEDESVQEQEPVEASEEPQEEEVAEPEVDYTPLQEAINARAKEIASQEVAEKERHFQSVKDREVKKTQIQYRALERKMNDLVGLVARGLDEDKQQTLAKRWEEVDKEVEAELSQPSDTEVLNRYEADVLQKELIRSGISLSDPQLMEAWKAQDPVRYSARARELLHPPVEDDSKEVKPKKPAKEAPAPAPKPAAASLSDEEFMKKIGDPSYDATPAELAKGKEISDKRNRGG